MSNEPWMFYKKQETVLSDYAILCDSGVFLTIFILYLLCTLRTLVEWKQNSKWEGFEKELTNIKCQQAAL